MKRTGRELLRAALARHVEAGGLLVGESVGVHGVTEGMGPDGLVRTPLSEGAAVGVAAGLALAGKRVVVELVDPIGLGRAADVFADLAALAARSAGAWTAPLVVIAPFAPVGALPAGVRVVVAATADDLVGLLAHALAAAEATVLQVSVAALDDVGDGAAVPGLGVAVSRCAGSAATVFAVGDSVAVALAAVDGADVEVLDLRALTGLDRAAIADRVCRSGRAVAVGVPDALLFALQDAFLHLESPLVALPADATAERIATAVQDALHY